MRYLTPSQGFLCFQSALSSGRSGRVIVTSSLPRTLGTPGPGRRPPAGHTTPALTFPQWPLRGRRCSSETTLWEALSGSEDTGKHHFTFYNIQYSIKSLIKYDRNYAAPYKTPSSWRWSDGAAMNHTAWAPGQPNNSWWGERCIRSVNTKLGSETGTWDDHKCWLKSANSLVCKMAVSNNWQSPFFFIFENSNRSLVLLKQKALWIEHMT